MPPIPGEAGVDYPVLTTVPDTGFACNSQSFLPGIYADQNADCQVRTARRGVAFHFPHSLAGLLHVPSRW